MQMMQRKKYKQKKVGAESHPKRNMPVQPEWGRTSLGSVQLTTEREQQGNTPLSQAGRQCLVFCIIHSTKRIDLMEQNWEYEQTRIQIITLALIHWTAYGKQYWRQSNVTLNRIMTVRRPTSNPHLWQYMQRLTLKLQSPLDSASPTH